MGKKERNSGTGKGDKTETPLRLQGQQRGRENTRQRLSELERAREGEGELMGWGNMGKHARQGRHGMNTRRGNLTTGKENKTQGHT